MLRARVVHRELGLEARHRELVHRDLLAVKLDAAHAVPDVLSHRTVPRRRSNSFTSPLSYPANTISSSLNEFPNATDQQSRAFTPSAGRTPRPARPSAARPTRARAVAPGGHQLGRAVPSVRAAAAVDGVHDGRVRLDVHHGRVRALVSDRLQVALEVPRGEVPLGEAARAERPALHARLVSPPPCSASGPRRPARTPAGTRSRARTRPSPRTRALLGIHFTSYDVICTLLLMCSSDSWPTETSMARVKRAHGRPGARQASRRACPTETRARVPRQTLADARDACRPALTAREWVTRENRKSLSLFANANRTWSTSVSSCVQTRNGQTTFTSRHRHSHFGPPSFSGVSSPNPNEAASSRSFCSICLCSSVMASTTLGRELAGEGGGSAASAPRGSTTAPRCLDHSLPNSSHCSRRGLRLEVPAELLARVPVPEHAHGRRQPHAVRAQDLAVKRRDLLQAGGARRRPSPFVPRRDWVEASSRARAYARRRLHASRLLWTRARARRRGADVRLRVRLRVRERRRRLLSLGETTGSIGCRVYVV